MKHAFRVLFTCVLLVGGYVASYYFLPRPFDLASIRHPTRLSKAYYRFFYPLRRVIHSYQKVYSGTVAEIQFANREFVLLTTPTCGIFVRVDRKHESFLRSLGTGESVHVLVQCVPDTDAGACHNELLTLSRVMSAGGPNF
jgi:hypothetical protein